MALGSSPEGVDGLELLVKETVTCGVRVHCQLGKGGDGGVVDLEEASPWKKEWA